jgi:N-acetylmuramoyl-L-alanine amidase CwlA
MSKYATEKKWISGLPKNTYADGKGNYRGVVLHFTDNYSSTIDGEVSFMTTNWRSAFVHGFAGLRNGQPAYVEVADPDYNCWGAGPKANPYYYQIELVVAHSQADFEKSVDIWCYKAAEKLAQRKLGVKAANDTNRGSGATILGHFQVTKYMGGTTHQDPVSYLQKYGWTWDMVVKKISGYYDDLTAPAKPATPSAPSKLYRVRKTWADDKSQVGAFADLDNAKACADQNKGTFVFDENGKSVYPAAASTAKLYRVRKDWKDAKTQVGAFSNLDNAKDCADQNAGTKVFDENGKVVYTPAKAESKVETPTPKPTPVTPEKPKTAIVGKSVIDYKAMAAFVQKQNPAFDEAIAKAFVEVGSKYNIKGDIAFCQSIIETGYFRFNDGTAVKPEQHNYAGIGVTSKGMTGNSFATVSDGVEAQMQHLFAYATKENLPGGVQPLDPRFNLVARGTCPNWEDLSNHWAMNAKYGDQIVSLYGQLVQFSQNYTPPAEKPETAGQNDAQNGANLPSENDPKGNDTPDETFKAKVISVIKEFFGGLFK